MTSHKDKKPATLNEVIGMHEQASAAFSAACRALDELETSQWGSKKPAARFTREHATRLKAVTKADMAERRAMDSLCTHACCSMNEVSVKSAYLLFLSKDREVLQPEHVQMLLASNVRLGTGEGARTGYPGSRSSLPRPLQAMRGQSGTRRFSLQFVNYARCLRADRQSTGGRVDGQRTANWRSRDY
jgi:hypothetical protein